MLVRGNQAGAGEGNRTLVFSLEGCCSTIELHPHLMIAPMAKSNADVTPSILARLFQAAIFTIMMAKLMSAAMMPPAMVVIDAMRIIRIWMSIEEQ